jgi:hypothetical protein
MLGCCHCSLYYLLLMNASLNCIKYFKILHSCCDKVRYYSYIQWHPVQKCQQRSVTYIYF